MTRENAMRTHVRDKISGWLDEARYQRQLDRLNKQIDGASTKAERAELVEQKIQLIRRHRLEKCGDIETPEV